jgi:hypothetical protein
MNACIHLCIRLTLLYLTSRSLVSAFSAESNWRDKKKEEEDLPEWANSTAVEMDWNKLQKRSLLDRIVGKVVDLDDEDDDENEEGVGAYQKLRNRIMARRKQENAKPTGQSKAEDKQEFFVTEAVERQIALGENLLEIVFPDISVDTENEVCPRCNFLLTDEDVVKGWSPTDSNDYTTSCPNCTQRFVPHFCVQCSSPTFMGSRGQGSPLTCERLSPWVLQKEIRSVMSDRTGIENLLNPKWREESYKNSVSTDGGACYYEVAATKCCEWVTQSFIRALTSMYRCCGGTWFSRACAIDSHFLSCCKATLSRI